MSAFPSFVHSEGRAVVTPRMAYIHEVTVGLNPEIARIAATGPIMPGVQNPAVRVDVEHPNCVLKSVRAIQQIAVSGHFDRRRVVRMKREVARTRSKLALHKRCVGRRELPRVLVESIDVNPVGSKIGDEDEIATRVGLSLMGVRRMTADGEAARRRCNRGPGDPTDH